MCIVNQYVYFCYPRVCYHEIEVCHMSSRFKRIMNKYTKFMKLVEHHGNMGWMVHELAWNHYKTEFAPRGDHCRSLEIYVS